MVCRHSGLNRSAALARVQALQLTCALLGSAAVVSAIEPVPAEPGLYYLHGKEFTRIEARSVTISQSGGGASAQIPTKRKIPTAGGSKVSAQILGDQAEHTVTSIPVFYYRLNYGDAAIGTGDLVLVR